MKMPVYFSQSSLDELKTVLKSAALASMGIKDFLLTFRKYAL